MNKYSHLKLIPVFLAFLILALVFQSALAAPKIGSQRYESGWQIVHAGQTMRVDHTIGALPGFLSVWINTAMKSNSVMDVEIPSYENPDISVVGVTDRYIYILNNGDHDYWIRVVAMH